MRMLVCPAGHHTPVLMGQAPNQRNGLWLARVEAEKGARQSSRLSTVRAHRATLTTKQTDRKTDMVTFLLV